MSPGLARRALRPRPGAAAAGLLVDRLLGEPPAPAHPVAAFGRLLSAVEQRWYADSRPRGLAYTGFGVAVGCAAGVAVSSAVAASWLACGRRALGEAARQVAAALAAGDLPAARAGLPTLVGRDPAGLGEPEIARAVVESVAENTVDAVVAPAVWAAAAGPVGAFGYRAVNTLDAMVGHRCPRYANFGWASARLDDLTGFLPARLTAALVALVRPAAAGDVWRAVRHQAGQHPSPNAGVAEAAFAAALGVRLGGVNRYRGRPEVRPRLGTGRPAAAGDIQRAVRLSGDVGWALGGLLAALGAGVRR